MDRASDEREELDRRWMRKALELASGAVGLTSPNPTVGCVLVRDGAVIGQGAHIYDARDHAEIAALKAAGGESAARGATAYVTLEPCSHTGRTGPCAEALVRAGVSRVVAATGDPNPAVSGRGFSLLRKAGIEVVAGVLGDEARRLNDGFARHIQAGLPFVTLKAGVSLDGRIAPARAAGGTVYLTGAAALGEVQEMRHASEAILVGVGTALVDDPLLTDRSGLARRKPLIRVVLDSRLRLPVDSRLVKSVGAPESGPVVVYTAEMPESGTGRDQRSSARQQCMEDLRGLGVEVVQVPFAGPEPVASSPDGLQSEQAKAEQRLNLKAVLHDLGRRGVLNLLVEGGSRLNRALLDGDHIDRLTLFYTPLVMGEDGVPLFAGAPGPRLPAIRTESRPVADMDVRMDLWLRDPWIVPEPAPELKTSEAPRS